MPARRKTTSPSKEIQRLFKAAERYADDIGDLELEDDDASMQDLDAALESLELVYREIIRLEPGNVEALTKLGALFLDRAGDADDEALIHLEAALALTPKDKKLATLVKKTRASVQRSRKH